MQTDGGSIASIEAERALLGSCLQGKAIATAVLEDLREDTLYFDQHRKIAAAIRAVVSAGHTPDIVTVTAKMTPSVGLYLAELVDLYCPTPHNYKAYLHLVSDAYTKRQFIGICERAIRSLQHGETTADESLAHLAEDVDALAHGSQATAIVPSSLRDTLQTWMRQSDERPLRIPTHVSKLNNCLGGGLAAGRLYYLGARPSVGKTSFAIDVARHAAKNGYAVLFISLEMPEVDGITTRALSQESSVSELSIRSGFLDAKDYPRMVAGAGTLSGLPIWVTDKARSIEGILRCASRWPFTPRLGLVIVDYLQLVRGPKSESRRVEIEEVSRSLKHLASDIHAPVVCISALKRREEDDREPSMSDLKETGELEYDGDAVVLLHRGFNAESAKLIIAKNKYGPVGTVSLLFKKSCVTFEQVPEE